MAHNIYKEKFQSFRQPAWHGLGYVSQEPFTAIQAGEKLGIPGVFTDALVTVGGHPVPGYKAIIGKDGDTLTVYSVVSNEYHEITHQDFINAYDEATDHALIETIGLLGKGETLFISAKLPSFTVKGDECENYLLAYNPLTGKEASTSRITPVRVVCANTLAQSAGRFKEEFRVIHSSDAARDIKAWIKRVWELSIAQTEAVREAFEILASKPVSDNQFREVLQGIYPDPAPIYREGSGAPAEEEIAYLKSRSKSLEHRNAVVELYQGAATGQTPAFVGSAWGAYNSVVEYEDYGKSRRRAASGLVGAGADRKDQAFHALLTL